MWYEMNIKNAVDEANLMADIRIPAESPWFHGHFPGNPVLPGIAQIEMVFDLIRQNTDHPVRVEEISRVRFKQMIVPDDRLRIAAAPKPAANGVYTFRILKTDELVTSGVIQVARIKKD